MFLETVERRKITFVAHGGESGNADIDANGACRCWQRLLNLSLSLNRHEPFAASGRHGNILGRTQHVAAVPITNPAQLGQKHAAVVLVDLELL
jgi:hypothetical protein